MRHVRSLDNLATEDGNSLVQLYRKYLTSKIRTLSHRLHKHHQNDQVPHQNDMCFLNPAPEDTEQGLV